MKYFKIRILSILLIVVLGILFFTLSPKEGSVVWGVNFSQKHSQDLGLDWKKNYTALIDDLGVKEIKLATYWDLVEPREGEYDFKDLDWQIKEAEEKGVNILFVLGRKTPRWPECHVPEWASNLNKEEQQTRISKLLEAVILRYRDSENIKMWQVENEPFFPFGECKWVDSDFLKEEVALVKSLDYKKRPVLISDSGEGSFWFKAASSGDVVGTTLYRKVWVWQLKTYISYPFPLAFYWIKSEVIEKLFNKEVICVELQAEPWGPELLYNSPLEEQEKTMNLEQFRKNIEFARGTGIEKCYLWGGEWWYWMKEKQGKLEIWEEARKLFAD
ncbi:MAG: beta-galactosidase [Candidatus Pacebacteria bacterium]|nr:beta-galactosidase [Candidatus Paceibacterota bacterium]